MAYADYLYRRENGIFYFRYLCKNGVTRFSLRTRSYLEAKKKSAFHLTRMVSRQLGDEMGLGYLCNSYSKMSPQQKIDYVTTHYPDYIKGNETNSELVAMFDVFTKVRDEIRESHLLDLAHKHFNCPPAESLIEHPVHPQLRSKRLLSEAINAFLQLIEGKKAKKTIISYESKLPFILELLGDKPLEEYQLEDFLVVEAKLKKFPKNGRSHPKYKGKSIDDIILLNTEKKMLSDNTVHSYLITMNTLFNKCVKWGWLNRSPCPTWEITLQQKESTGWEPWNKEDIQRLLDSPFFTNKVHKFKHPHNYWVPLIALFSGMRIDECCQLYLTDIVEKEGVMCFSINELLDKKAKTHKVRYVPVSPVLSELGLFEYLDGLKKAKEHRVFPTFKLGTSGYSTNFSKSIGKYIRRHITKDKKKVFHGLRDTFATAILAQGYSREIIAELLGHAGEHQITELYTGKYPVKLKLEAIEKIDYGIDIVSTLKNRY